MESSSTRPLKAGISEPGTPPAITRNKSLSWSPRSIRAARQIRPSAALRLDSMAGSAEDPKHPSPGFSRFGVGSEWILLGVAEPGREQNHRHSHQ